MGMLYIVGLGPGAGEGMTLAAHRALSRCGAIVGYSAYIDLLEGLYPEARRVSTGMMREVERCRAALELARDGDEVALVCSGDAGVYGMASPALELGADFPDEAAAWGDFCIALYNPRSKKRSGHLARAVQVLLRHKGPDTVCGWVRMIGREGQQSGICTLDELGSLEADMFTTVFVGNAATRVADGRMVTPRGYRGLS